MKNKINKHELKKIKKKKLIEKKQNSITIFKNHNFVILYFNFNKKKIFVLI